MTDIDTTMNTSANNISTMSAPGVRRRDLDSIRAQSASEMSITEMFEKITKVVPWGIDQYQTPKDYLDIKLLAKIREGKFKTPAPKATKKGSFMEDIIKIGKVIPAPNHYKIQAEHKILKTKPKVVPDRTTLTAEIIKNGKKRPTPGPSSYKTIKNNKEIEEDLRKLRTKSKSRGVSDKGYFLSGIEFASSKVPGPGMYDPRPSSAAAKPDKTTPDFWRKKHGSQKLGKPDVPGVGVYDPMPTSFDTFQKFIKLRQEKKDIVYKSTMGIAERFKISKREKENKIPGPADYFVTSEWAGKPEKKQNKEKTKDILSRITKGPEISFYYEQQIQGMEQSSSYHQKVIQLSLEAYQVIIGCLSSGD